jgi:hypothetical protein
MSNRRVYFAHGYKADDRPINEFFWGELRAQRFYAWIDTGLSRGGTGDKLAMDVAFNEWMLSQCDGFVAIVRNRESSYQLLEYRLATRMRLPRLVFVEEGRAFPKPLPDTRLQYPGQWQRFFDDDLQNRIHAAIGRFGSEVDTFAGVRSSLTSAGFWSRSAGGGSLNVALLPPRGGAWDAVSDGLRGMWDENVSFKTLHPKDVRAEFSILGELSNFDLLVVDVGPHGTPPELVGFLHGIGIPQIRVCRVESDAERQSLARTLPREAPARSLADADSSAGLPRFLDGYQLDKAMTPVGFWSEPTEFLAHLRSTIERITSFQSNVHRLETRRESRRYFGLRHPQPPRANVFLSFAGAGNASAVTENIAAALRFSGFHCFHYTDPGLKGEGRLESGEDINDGLRMRVDDSDIVVAFLDENYEKSTYCMNELEIAVALSQKGDLSLLPFSLKDGRPPPASLRGIAIKTYPENPGWASREAVEDLIEAVEDAATRMDRLEGLEAGILESWLDKDGRVQREDLLRLLTNRNVPEKDARAWLAGLPEGAWRDALLAVPHESPTRQRHKAMITLLLLSLAEEDVTRRETVERWLRLTKLLNWSGIGYPKHEDVVEVGVPQLGTSPPSDVVLLGEALGQEYPSLLKSSDPLCLNADARVLANPLEYTRQGRDGEPLALLRPVRWRLKKATTRTSLHQDRTDRALPPSVLLLALAAEDLGTPDREVREVSQLLRGEYRKLAWPDARIETRQVGSADELLRTLTDVRHGIVHVAGHSGYAGLQVGRELVPGEKIAQALNGSDVRLLVLNGCSAAAPRSPLATGTVSLVDLLVTRGRVAEIVAHRNEITDEDAVAFALRFFSEFCRDLDVGRAVREARTAGSERLQLTPIAVSNRPVTA